MRHLLKDPELWCTGAFIGGEWINATSHGTYALRNPANNDVLLELPRFKEAETANAIEVAHQAFLRWRQTTAKVRSQILYRWYELMQEHRDDLATLITLGHIRLSMGHTRLDRVSMASNA
jgi:succinate-semialdehyde dehydrogenase/glutarate-semialdehyde dehydrogenase